MHPLIRMYVIGLLIVYFVLQKYKLLLNAAVKQNNVKVWAKRCEGRISSSAVVWIEGHIPQSGASRAGEELLLPNPSCICGRQTCEHK